MLYNSNNKTKKFRGGEEKDPLVSESSTEMPEVVPPSSPPEETNEFQGQEFGVPQGQGPEPAPENANEFGDQQGQGPELSPENANEFGEVQRQGQEDITGQQDGMNEFDSSDPQTNATGYYSQESDLEYFREKMSNEANQEDYLYMNENISTEPNKSKAYTRQGIFHFTNSMDINAIKSIIQNVAENEMESIVYDKLQTITLTKVGIILGENKRCYNTTIKTKRKEDTLFVHVYGTLYVKK